MEINSSNLRGHNVAEKHRQQATELAQKESYEQKRLLSRHKNRISEDGSDVGNNNYARYRSNVYPTPAERYSGRQRQQPDQHDELMGVKQGLRYKVDSIQSGDSRRVR